MADQIINLAFLKLFFPSCRIERSTDQVIKPVNLEALAKWVGHIPDGVVEDMARIAPMLAKLGYDPKANPPNYGNPDALVINNTKRVCSKIFYSKYLYLSHFLFCR